MVSLTVIAVQPCYHYPAARLLHEVYYDASQKVNYQLIALLIHIIRHIYFICNIITPI
ncbi:hypothetical protein D3C74_89730 [compost metagenome]